MTAPRKPSAANPDVDPAWLERQLSRFTSSDMDGVVRLLRSFDRQDMERARRGTAA